MIVTKSLAIFAADERGAVLPFWGVSLTVLLGLVAMSFDLGRIASMGAIFYLVMDIIIHWGVLRRMREEVDANPVILVSAIILDAVALIAFIVMKALNDPLIIVISLGGIVAIFAFESWFLRRAGGSEADDGETEADAQ